MEDKKYFLGLDVGTDSVGWCLTDQDYNVIKKQGKSLWGVRMFEQGQTAEERRSHRSQRRRICRQRERIDLLQSLFSEEVHKVDPTFFERLNESAFHFSDRTVNRENQYTLFISKEFTDKDYFKKYPTIFHLRKHLLESNEKEDIRLIYLACHNIMKHRGNFLEPNFKPDNPFDVEEAEAIFKEIYEISHDDVTLTFNYEGNVEKMLGEFIKPQGVKALNEGLNNILYGSPVGDKTSPAYKVYIPLLSGSKKTFKDLVKVFNVDEDIDDESLKVELTLDSEKFDENIADLEGKYSNVLGDELDVVVECKKLRDMFTLAKVLGKGNPYISVAMVNQYNENERDLRALKKYVKNNYGLAKYNEIFRKTNIEGNYVSYIGSTSYAGNTVPAVKKCSLDDFYKFLKRSLFLNAEKGSFDKEVLDKMESGSYLLKLRNSTNGKYPYQLNELELRTILEKQRKFYPFLNVSDGNKEYPTVADKIVSILTFKIPYYVGPLYTNDKQDDERKKYSWLVKNSREKVLPWTFDKVVNTDKTAEEFIRRMQNKCTYLKGENDYCLPRKSIIYSYYDLLNFLNKKYVNGEPISHDDKMEIIRDLYLEDKNVTMKKIAGWYKKKYGSAVEVEITTSTNKEIEPEDVKANMDSFITLKNIFGYTNKQMEEKIVDLEKLIKDVTIFEDKDILERRLKNGKSEYPSLNLTDEAIKKIKGLSYTDWGKFSYNLLCGIKNNEGATILQTMEDTNKNFNQVLLEKDSEFNEAMTDYNHKTSYKPATLTVQEYIQEMPTSAQVKRALNQTYLIIEELEKIVGHKIDKYFIEFARSEGKKERTKTRKDSMSELYRNIKEHEYDTIKEQLGDEVDLRSDRLFLYYQQLGKCMYSGEPIDVERLSEDYEIDHIIPWSIDNNDSFDNKVLVKKEYNQEKTNTYPIDRNLLWKNRGGYRAAEQYWKYLRDSKLISAEKYARLTRREEISEKDTEDFINRQLTSTNQTTRSLATLLKEYLDVSEQNIVYSKANIVSYYRNRFDIYKSRTANNFHHAHDAYLNIVLGNVASEYFKDKHIRDLYINDESTGKKVLTTNIEKVLDYDRPVCNINGVVIYQKNEFKKTIENQIFNHFDILTTTRAYEDNNMLSKVTIKPKGEGKYPVKSSGPYTNLESYGGYTDPKYAFYTLVKTSKNGKEKTLLIPIPAFYKNDIRGYIQDTLGYDNPEIILEKVKINTIVKTGKTKFCLTGVSGTTFLIKNVRERIFSKEQIKTIHDIDKFFDLVKKQGLTINNKLFDLSDSTYEKNKAKVLGQFNYVINSGATELTLSKSLDPKKSDTKLTKGQMLGMYDDVINLFTAKDGCSEDGEYVFNYSNILTLAENLKDKRDLFQSLDLLKQIYLINELLVLLKCNQRGLANLEFLELPPHCGMMTVSFSIADHFQLIAESPTGFYTKVLHEQ